jgi:hypothetical protein
MELLTYLRTHMRQKQSSFFNTHAKSYGGILLNTRKGRSTARPLDTKNTMHLVLRSTKATGEWSFKRSKNELKIRHIIQKFSLRFGVQLHSLAVVGNHLHMHFKLTNRYTYRPFIRAVTASIAMAITGMSRWNKIQQKANATSSGSLKSFKFWDYRPFTRVVQSFRARLQLDDYIQINQLENFGYSRISARELLGMNWYKQNTS